VDGELEVIHNQMEETRASLAEKIEALESKVTQTVQTATETVSSAVEGAKEVVSSVTEGAKQVVETVTETVETVKEKLSISRYVERYPWTSFGVSVAAGFLAGRLLPSWSSSSGHTSTGYYPSQPQTAPPQAPRYQPSSSQWGSTAKGVLETTASTVGGMALGTLMSALKGLVTRSLPQQWQSELTRMMDDVTTRLGGKVMQGNPLQELLSSFSGRQDNQHNGSDAAHSSGQPAGQGTRT
jgi:ElaB/YqjD/DUF883 family membrane-anchored ribosome-binding protein